MSKSLHHLCSNESELEQAVSSFSQRSDITRLIKENGIGLELGVAEGGFSKRLLEFSPLAYLYSIDMWAGDRTHDVEQYKTAIRNLSPYKEKNSILRMRFDEALDLFDNEFFDFIYVDGYAHTGEEDGKTFKDWFPKLKSGGIFAGDDYDPGWPLVVEQVDKFVAENNLTLHVIDCRENSDPYSRSPSWLAIKK